jgi:hypothetical protein
MSTLLNYQKRKNTELFQTLEREDLTFLSQTQNYIPIYKRFFSLNETNYNHINLNHKWFLSNVREKVEVEDEGSESGSGSGSGSEEDDESSKYEIPNVFVCTLKNSQTNKTKVKNAFLKMAPLLDPYKFLIGKYDADDSALYTLPTLTGEGNAIINDANNSAYVDGFFCFLSSQLLHHHGFLHGLDYYGSFLAIKNNFSINVYDDLEYLNQSDYFLKNMNKLFFVDEYNFQGGEEEEGKLPAIHIDKTKTCNSNISLYSIDENMYGEVFSNPHILSLQDEKSKEILEDITNQPMEITHSEKASLKSNSTCSSRTSHTEEDPEEKEKVKEGEKEEEETVWEDEEEEEDESEDDECVEAIIPKFPVQVICMEHCESTLDDLLVNEEINEEELLSALMQIIMTLCAYQKVFSLTHNDLHTNNVMYIPTDKKYLYYCFKKKVYKVPTYGKLYKIIDFGRAIYKLDGKLFCSNSFQHGNDASTQYNIEPYFNEKKPRLEPNFSFDLTRLACSMYDYIIEENGEFIAPFSKKMDLVKDWCKDDKGINVLYKANGEDRYPQFKLYKMIARCVHKHTPQNQLERSEFASYVIPKANIPEKETIMNLDELPVLL